MDTPYYRDAKSHLKIILHYILTGLKLSSDKMLFLTRSDGLGKKGNHFYSHGRQDAGVYLARYYELIYISIVVAY